MSGIIERALAELKSQAEVHPIGERLLLSLALLVLALLLRLAIRRWLRRRELGAVVLYRSRKATDYTLAIVVGLALIPVWAAELRSFSTVLGLAAAGLVIALRDLVASLAGWTFILLRRPFEVGDRIEVGSIRGDVIDQRIFQFTLMEIGKWVEADQSTGRVVHVPNFFVLNHPVHNYTRGFPLIWNEIRVHLTLDSDWKRARADLLAAVEAISAEAIAIAERALQQGTEKYLLFYSRLTPIIYTQVDERGIRLTARHLCEPRRRRGADQAVWEELLTQWSGDESIQFAHPTYRLVGFSEKERPAPPP